jgi:N-acetylglucosaminyldiphosphoundecaprenol N-acetyl-beta-D-mannosaminyltransferase
MQTKKIIYLIDNLNHGTMMNHSSLNYPSEPEYVKFMDVKIDNLKFEGIYAKIQNNIEKKGYVCLTDSNNVIVAATRNRDLLDAINESLISIPDGTPLAWYGKLVGCKRIERISGAELMRLMLEETHGLKHYLLGDTEQTINRVIEKAKKKNKDLRINGHSPPFKEKFDRNDTLEMLDEIHKDNPDIIWVSFGGGKQDIWMQQNLHLLNRGVMIGVGAAFRYYIGEIKIPPKIIQRIGMQWFFRMLDNPSKWFKAGVPKRHLTLLANFPAEIVKARKRRMRSCQ